MALIQTQHLKPYDSLTAALSRNELRGKTVLITGGGYGIGAAAAKSFAAAGASKVILVGRTASKLEATVKELAAAFSATHFTHHVADIASKADIDSLFASLDASPDILLNNAGYMAEPAPFPSADLDDFWRAFTVNVYGTAAVTQAFLRHREQRGAPASASAAVVITVNTLAAYSVRIPGLGSYGASKAALARLMELVAVDVPDTTARFVSVHPGAVETDMFVRSRLGGSVQTTDVDLAADFLAWAATPDAAFLAGRFAWVNWDVDELLARREEIVAADLFRTSVAAA